jgi:FAD:protein FMN transferase
MKNLTYVLISLAAMLIVGCDSPPSLNQLKGSTMGTYYIVKFWSVKPVSDAKVKQIHNDIEAKLKDINQSMSTYIADSELSLINQKPSEQWLEISPELHHVLSAALRLHKQCDNDYDVTVGPLVNLWGFGPQQKPEKVPSRQDIELANERVGSQFIELAKDGEQFQLKKSKQLYIDLSSLAKGYGVDQISHILSLYDMDGYLVDIGGEIKLKGNKSDGDKWQIAVVSPDSLLDNTVYQAFSVKDIAMATSGDYRNYFEEDGVRYSHTIDPKTAKPINHKLASVSVLDKSSMWSDALATCLLVKGDKAGFKWAEQHKIAAYFITKENDLFVATKTTKFKEITGVQ